MRHIFLYFITFIVAQIVATAAVAAVWPWLTGQSPLSAEGLIATSALSSLITIVWFLCTGWWGRSTDFFRRPKAWLTIGLSVLLGLAMLLPLQHMEELIPQAWRQDVLGDTFRFIMASPWGFIPVALLAPLAEEIVFRGAIQSAALGYFARRMPNAVRARTIALWLTAVLFAVVHGNPAQMPHALIVGLLLGWLTLLTGSIIPAIAVHFTNNAAAYLLAHLRPETIDMTAREMFGPHATAYFVTILALALVCGLCLALLIRYNER